MLSHKLHIVSIAYFLMDHMMHSKANYEMFYLFFHIHMHTHNLRNNFQTLHFFTFHFALHYKTKVDFKIKDYFIEVILDVSLCEILAPPP